MSDKKGILGFFKSWGSIAEDEKKPSKGQSQRKKRSQDADVKMDIPDDVIAYAVSQLEQLLSLAEFDGKVKHKVGRDLLYLDIYDSEEDTGRIIGKSGSTIDSLQTLIQNFVIQKFNQSYKIQVDIEEYRIRRKKQIKSMALKAADELRQNGGEAPLEPMKPAERRVVHLLFEKDQDIDTRSEGSGRHRHIVLVNKANAR
ncbi:MAG: hypothetical protein CL521_03400 [Actinobacteria bacterium]|nr:hypothetical protein [Actinomycetota bacterium]|tara:strand:+ start:410 stop:1009 length:600 start_codon:yes stop_codon:yes gene_type:complete